MKFKEVLFGSYDRDFIYGFSNDNLDNVGVDVEVEGNHSEANALLQSLYINFRHDDWQIEYFKWEALVTRIVRRTATSTVFKVRLAHYIKASLGDILIDPAELNIRAKVLLVVPEVGD